MSDHNNVILAKPKRLAFSDANLVAHDVSERNHFRHWMLNLNARVHLHEVKALVFVEQKLKRSGARITNRPARRDRRFTHLLT